MYIIKHIFSILLFFAISSYAFGQKTKKSMGASSVNFVKKFPDDWFGHWKGKLSWSKYNTDTPVVFTMQLIIKPTNDKNVITWKIQYGDSLTDVRPYTCKLIDSVKKHWLIDEQNGILIDQFVIGNNAFSCFNVQGTTITDSYQLQPNGGMRVEFISGATKAIRTSGNNTEDSPTVESFKIGSFQVGTLYKIKEK
jgi:hypothetical protein